MQEQPKWPYNLPIWRRYHQATSPDGKLVARINPAVEISMGNPTFGTLCMSHGLHIPNCNPSFIWSDDSQFLAVPQFFMSVIHFNRQRLLVVDFRQQRVYASKMTAWYFQPETFVGGTLGVTINPFYSKRTVEFKIPSDISRTFKMVLVPWPEILQEGAD
jgi:hypothetical protein